MIKNDETTTLNDDANKWQSSTTSSATYENMHISAIQMSSSSFSLAHRRRRLLMQRKRSRRKASETAATTSDDEDNDDDDDNEDGTNIRDGNQPHSESAASLSDELNDDSLMIAAANSNEPCLLCIVRRIPQTERVTGANSSIEQFTTRLDTSGKIIGVDTSGVSAVYSQYLNKDLIGRIIQELCLPSELPKLSSHLKEVLTLGKGTSAIYRLQLTEDKFIAVQTKSKVFENFIMATHSIVRYLSFLLFFFFKNFSISNKEDFKIAK